MHLWAWRSGDRDIRQVREAFAFLQTEYGFDEGSVRQEGRGIYGVTFRNRTTFVTATVERGGAWVAFGPLSDGDVPAYPRDHFDVDDLAVLRGFPVAPDSDAVRERLHNAAQALREIGDDVLRGDFECLSTLQERVRERAIHIQEKRGLPPDVAERSRKGDG